MAEKKSKIKQADQNPDFVAKENELLKWWYESGIVDKYLHKNDASDKRFSFMDGPITANNQMGVHHAWGRTLKDIYQRYYNLKGYKQRFQNGFDNQGLWVEVEVEKSKKFKSKHDIEDYGVDKFVQECKDWTQNWANVQTEQSKRLGYFMDWDNSYYTMSEENNYTIWEFLKKCYENGDVYKGWDSLPWCPRCGTAISQHEILTEDYKDLEDEAVYFKLKLKGKKNEFLLVWTTTPWTLVANVGVAINDEFNYAKVEHEGETLYIVETRVKDLLGESAKVLGTVLGKEMLGWEYEPLFTPKEIPALSDFKPKYSVVSGGMQVAVTDADGTGMVHLAPGCGAEDYQLGLALGLEKICPIDENGVYFENYGFLSKKYAHDVNAEVFANLKEKGFLFKSEKYMHRYPMCWRCKTKLVFRLVEEWFISMDKLRYKMMEVTKQINWMPAYGMDRELDWLKNMHDWCISKKRYWGLALPIWVCDDCKEFQVIGSKEELKEKAVDGWDKFEGHTPHKPHVDEVVVKCEKCGGIAHRVKDVGNPWLDAGIVPYSTLKYRTDKKYWEEWFPADFVTECFPGQFKNWFYALIAMSTVMENKPPFKNLLGHELVKDEKGEEMHKSKGNAIAFNEAAEKAGVDTLRWMYSKQNPTTQLLMGYKVTDEIRRSFFLMLWNSFKYFTTYAELANFEPSGKKLTDLELTPLDKWILTKTENLKKTVEDGLNKYDSVTPAKSIEEYVLDLSTWYIRRSRDRFASLDGVALEVMYYALTSLTPMLSIFMPFVSETMYQTLVKPVSKDAKESVHLEIFPEVVEDYVFENVLHEMDAVKNLATLGQSVRVENGFKVRQPLGKLLIDGVKLEQEYIDILLDELNVKVGELMKDQPKGENWKLAENGVLKIWIDTTITEELREEGIVREALRAIQNERKKSGLKVGESVVVVITGSKETEEVLTKNVDQIKKQVFASSVLFDKSQVESDKDSKVVYVEIK